MAKHDAALCLRIALNYLKEVADKARTWDKDATVRLALCAIKEDGSGKMFGSFEWEQFAADLQALLTVEDDGDGTSTIH